MADDLLLQAQEAVTSLASYEVSLVTNVADRMRMLHLPESWSNERRQWLVSAPRTEKFELLLAELGVLHILVYATALAVTDAFM